MTVERADQVVTLARAHADDADRPGRHRVEGRAEVPLYERESPLQRAAGRVVRAVPGDPVLLGRDVPRIAQPARAFSIESTSSGASGTTIGEKRASTLPSRPTRNFSKFHWMSPSRPSASFTGVSAW